MEMLRGIDEETVDFGPNYDGQHDEPLVLPARFPNLLVNGSAGIAVGMATNIPPHNLGEVIDATLHFIDNPEATTRDLMAFVKGPDFPTAGQIIGTAAVSRCVPDRTGLDPPGEIDVEEAPNGTARPIVATEFPYQVSLQRTAERIAELIKNDRLGGIANVFDESDKEGPRLIVDSRTPSRTWC